MAVTYDRLAAAKDLAAKSLGGIADEAIRAVLLERVEKVKDTHWAADLAFRSLIVAMFEAIEMLQKASETAKDQLGEEEFKKLFLTAKEGKDKSFLEFVMEVLGSLKEEYAIHGKTATEVAAVELKGQKDLLYLHLDQEKKLEKFIGYANSLIGQLANPYGKCPSWKNAEKTERCGCRLEKGQEFCPDCQREYSEREAHRIELEKQRLEKVKKDLQIAQEEEDLQARENHRRPTVYGGLLNDGTLPYQARERLREAKERAEQKKVEKPAAQEADHPVKADESLGAGLDQETRDALADLSRTSDEAPKKKKPQKKSGKPRRPSGDDED